MNIRNAVALMLFSLFITAVPPVAFGFEELSDQELNAVTAGSIDASHSEEALKRIPFRYSSGKGEVDGEVLVLPMADFQSQATLQLMDNAQSNLRSLINVNAVNSPVQILLNLNINVNSTIGNINQLNHLISSQGSWR